MSIDFAPASPRLSAVKYDQSRQVHPFARPRRDGEWTVQPPGQRAPIGLVRSRVTESGELEFLTFAWGQDGPAATPFDETHPTLFHAVSWLRWRYGVRGA